MSIWTLIEFVFVFIVGFHASLFVWLLVRFVYGFAWSMVAFYSVVGTVIFLLMRISA